VPAGAVVLPNQNGTAPGFYLKQNISPTISSPHLFVLPGPPRELRPMFRDSVLSLVQSISPPPSVQRRVYRIANMGESIVERAVGKKLLAIPNIELGYCARPAEVDLRVIGDATTLERAEAIINAELGGSIFSSADEDLEQVVVKLLTERKETLAIAESCTGGLITSRLTDVPGSSRYVERGVVTYSNASKIELLGVPEEMIAAHGAVSEAVATAMAQGIRTRAQVDIGVGVTGIAGPDGGTPDKPVGTVCIAAISPADTRVRTFRFVGGREMVKFQASQAALDMVRRMLLDAN